VQDAASNIMGVNDIGLLKQIASTWKQLTRSTESENEPKNKRITSDYT
jgi:hypothetical protein